MDSFGHSQTNQRLLADLGMDATFGGRHNKMEMDWRKANKELEFIWNPYEDAEIFTHLTHDGSYGNPDFLEFDGYNH